MEYYFLGTVERVIFENASNYFKIVLLNIDETDSDFEDVDIIVTGTMADIIEGQDYTFWGNLTRHPKYGEQLQVSRYEKARPSASGLINYFSSPQFSGIGKKTAKKIVDLYGDNAIDQILEDPNQLKKIKGLSALTREKFLAKLKLNYGTEQILARLATYGLNHRVSLTIFDYYKEEALDVIKENPYQLVEDIKGIGFTVADQLAEQLGISSDSPQRFRAALIHSLTKLSWDRGDTYVEARDLLEQSLSLLEESRSLEIDPSLVAQELSQLIADGKVQHSDTKIFENSLFHAEAGIQKNLRRILDNSLEQVLDQHRLNEEIEKTEKQLGITYDQEQKTAICQALSQKVFILTGGPGTGKTTIIKGIIDIYSRIHQIDTKKKDLPIILAAPTGRAARRMNELTGLPSATIHRHLGLTSDDSDYQALDDYLDGDLIIVDEFSMVDTWLAHQLLAAIASHSQVIIVGDSDQLPSVGPGQVLADLLAIADIPQARLEKIFRQSDQSTIVTLASQMREGQLPHDFTEKKPDRSYFEAQAQHIPQMVEKIVQAALNSGLAPQDIQILAPMYRGLAGITNLNKLLQDLLNPLRDQLEFNVNDQAFRKGDKVLHLVNDAELNVFNGDIGYITDLIPAKYTESKQDEILLDFDGIETSYPRKDWHKITLAYAMSIHKSQGSEFPVIILPLTSQSGRMLQRNLIYTAITRAKSKLVLLGEWTAFDYAVKQEGTQRKTYLKERFLPELIPTESKTYPQDVDKPVGNDPISGENSTPSLETRDNYRLTEDNWSRIDPMIGLTKADIEAFFNKS
ncbi:SF1B family DNA helicase RecD2 [Streptococcus cuniculipharyngis]|uniref:ATP-dependent RecD2 DNA helicase n=1 Tax=Streptococcus cuniculipharyngis TaxID=1562651 RepID=A0A5C5SD44_9STRE|nr:ATP-dependent RecD-like DNA helicase [Streptococcus cuniculipharyngis]TWS98202.1 ATP-dependent RecD-like DNA helicase [Streptococcus cuniculipharyngis]